MKKRMIQHIIIIIMLALLCPLTVLASENGIRAAQITQTLSSYKVSPEWQPDLESNTKLLDELKGLIENLNASDIAALGANKDLALRYYNSYCELLGQSPVQAAQGEAAEVNTLRSEALKILNSLIKGQVNPEVVGDITENSAQIENMLMLVYRYTEQDCAASPQAERDSIKAYLSALYKYKGWDKAELDLLFSTSEYPEQTSAPAPKTLLDTNRITQETPKMPSVQAPKNSFADKSASLITVVIAVLIWLSLLVGIVILLKQRTERHYKA